MERGRWSLVSGLDGVGTPHCWTRLLWKGVGAQWCQDWMGWVLLIVGLGCCGKG